jgi:hypothetical protein
MTTPHNPYQAPTADLTQKTVPYSGAGSIANGIAGNYEFSVRAIIGEAWSKVSGFKGTCWLAFLFYALAVYPLMFGIEFAMHSLGWINEAGDSSGRQVLVMVVFQVAMMAFVLPIGVGLFMLGLKRATETPVQASEVFSYFSKAVSLFVTMLLMYVMIFIGFILLVLPGIYLMVAYCLALPLVAEKNLSPWRALEVSRKAVTHRWFRFVGLYLVMMVIMVLAMIPIGIGMIWVLPMFLLVIGIIYRNIFGLGGV